MSHSDQPAGANQEIPKLAFDLQHFRRPTIPFANARTALLAFLRALSISEHDEIWLPSYVGWSNREGSGVFDPIIETGVRFDFYRMSSALQIDLDDLISKFRVSRPRLIVFIHYFGYPDDNLKQLVEIAKEHECLVLEDEAHAFFSDWVGGVCGRYGDAAIFSLHKMLPFASGGLLVLNGTLDPNFVRRTEIAQAQQPLEHSPFDYDLSKISAARRANAMHLTRLLQPLAGSLDMLFPSLPDGVVPQTLPTIVQRHSRDDLYHALNHAGFGVVSLYHTLIAPITVTRYPESHHLARHILNLPVHQDIRPGQIEDMVAYLAMLLKE